MIEESGRVVAIEPDHLWLATIRRSTCQSCSARAGCGQNLLSGISPQEGLLKVPLQQASADDFVLGQQVRVGISEQALLKASGLAYFMPLLSLLLAAGLGQYLGGEGGAIVGALLGLLLGAAGVAWYNRNRACVSEYQPQLLSTGTNSPEGDPIKLP